MREITGRHVLTATMVFFAVVIAANGIFVYLALKSWTGLSTDHPYQRGVEYNETLAAAEAQKALGWRGRITFVDLGERRGRIALSMLDRRGAAVEHLEVSGTVRRPTHEGMDQEITLERAGQGLYEAELVFPRAGQWDVRLVARGRGGRAFRIEERIWLK